MSTVDPRRTITNLVWVPQVGRARLVRRPGRPDEVLVGPQGTVRACAERPDRLILESTEIEPRPWLSPEGGRGAFRSGLEPGTVYTAAVTFAVPRLLSGLPRRRLRIVALAVVGDRIVEVAVSPRASGERGEHRVSVTFRVPPDAASAWLRIQGGSEPGDRVGISDLALTPTSAALPYFDGDTPADRSYVYAWSGQPGRSTSTRTMRAPGESFPAGSAPEEIADEILRRLSSYLVGEATVLTEHLTSIAGDGPLCEACRILVEEGAALGELAGDDPALRGPEADAVRRRTTAAVDRLAREGTGRDAAAMWLRTLVAERSVELTMSRGVAEQLSTLLRPVAEALDAPARTRYLFAYVLDALDRTAASEIIRATAGRDVATRFAAAAAAAETTGFPGRVEIGRFVAEHLDVIRERAAYGEDIVDRSLGDEPIFMYWGQGFADAPPIVRLCRNALLRHHSMQNVHFLDDSLLPSYSELPDTVVSGTRGLRAHRAGALRLDLLARYGGYWVDATCLVTGSITAMRPERGDFFAFERAPARISSWFMAARPESYLLQMLRSAVWLWWETRQDLPEYLFLGGLFEMLYRHDQRFRAEWDATDAPTADRSHALQQMMLLPGRGRSLDEVLVTAPIHKLSRKYDPTNVPLGSALSVLYRRMPAWASSLNE